jgi:hypothetical protein
MNNEPEYREYRNNQIESGAQFQDFVVSVCWQTIGLAIVQYSSKLYQQTVGESRTGAEIKNDRNFCTSGNLYIELMEKAEPREGPYAMSGINRTDNSWLFIIGDYDTIFIFAKSILLGLYRTGKYREVENKTKTSRAFLLPVEDAQRYAAVILEPKASDKIKKISAELKSITSDMFKKLTDKQQMLLFENQSPPIDPA